MSLPHVFGMTPLGGDYREESYSLAKRLQGTGTYTADEDGARLRELLAWAELHADGRQALDRVAANIMPDKSLELLAAWENYLRVPNTAPRTIEQRQARAQLFYDLVTRADVTTLTAFVAVLASSATIHTPTRATVSGQGSSPETALHFAVRISDAQFIDPLYRRALDILARVIPGRSLGSMSRPARFDDQQIFTTIEAKYASSSQRLDRTILLNSTERTFANGRNPARHRDYGPISLLKAEDLNNMQEAFIFEGAIETSGSPATEDFIARWFSISLADATQGELDDSIDWRDRIVSVFARVSSNDIRPGQANDDVFNTASYSEYTHMYTQSGATGIPPQTYDAQLGSTNVWVRADDTTGELAIYNDSGGTIRVVGVAIASGVTGAV